MAKFSFKLRRTPKKRNAAISGGGGGAGGSGGGGGGGGGPPSTTRPMQYRPPPEKNEQQQQEQPPPPKKKLFFGSSSNKNDRRGPGGLEVTTATAMTLDSGGGGQDEVSVITPVTGLPPDSPDRLRNLASLLPPPPHPTTNNNNVGLYNEKKREEEELTSFSPPSTPSRGDMRIQIPTTAANNADHDNSTMEEDDDISAMTPLSPENKTRKSNNNHQQQQQQKHRRILSPPQQQLLEDDESRELTIYEEEEEDNESGGSGGVAGALLGKIKHKLSPKKTALHFFSNESNDNGSRETQQKKQRQSNQQQSNQQHKHKKQQQQLDPSIRQSIQKINQTYHKKSSSRLSWFTKTSYFQKAIDSSFDTIDTDKSGDVTLEELYAGLLLIHLKLAVYAGAPACRPASKEYVTEIFHLLDTDDSGTLTKEEFGTVMKILYSQVFTRIMIQWGLTLMIVPIISQYIIKYTTLLYFIAHEFWKDIDDELDPLQRFLWNLWGAFTLHVMPSWLDRVLACIATAFQKVPKGIWKSMPYTFLTLAQTSVALPYALNKVEEFFRRVAHKDVVGKKMEEEDKRSGRLKEC